MDWLIQGEIGELRAIDSSICFAFDKGDEHRTFNKALAGGALLDLGIYSVNLSQWFAKANPVNIGAMAKIGHTGVDNILMTNMRYTNGVMAQFTTAMEAHSSNYLLLQGSKGTIELQQMFWAGHKVTLTNDDKTICMDLPHAVNGFEYQIQEVQRCIKNNETYSNVMPITDTLANMQVMDEIRRQIELDYGELEHS
nr:Gfo/Idh/MocA family oxidoreductase [Neptunicella marina]